jgi:hypothetical protein
MAGREGWAMYARLAAVPAVLITAAIGLAGQASADNELSGKYQAVYSGSNRSTNQTWQFTPCGAGCSRQDLEGGLSKEFHLEVATWTTSSSENGDICRTTIDSNTLAGTIGCGFVTFPIQLTPVG